MTLQQEYLGVPPFNLNVSEFAPHCHDATWTLAYALNETLTSEFGLVGYECRN